MSAQNGNTGIISTCTFNGRIEGMGDESVICGSIKRRYIEDARRTKDTVCEALVIVMACGEDWHCREELEYRGNSRKSTQLDRKSVV